MKSGRSNLFQTAIALAITAAAGSTRSVAQFPPTTQPTPNAADHSASDALDRMLNPANQAPAPLIPVTFPPVPTRATAGAMGPLVTTQPTIREGTYMKDRSGVLSRNADGSQAIFTFDPDGSPIPEPPMVVLPNLKLQLMEQALSSNGPPPHFRGITGLLTSYRTHNYLYVTQVSGTDTIHAALAGMSLPQATTTADLNASLNTSNLPLASTPNNQTQNSPANPSASELLDRMLKPATEAPMPLLSIATPPPANQATVTTIAPGAAVQTIVHEGTPVIDRTGRLSRSADGQPKLFSFDADGRAMQDPPLADSCRT